MSTRTETVGFARTTSLAQRATCAVAIGILTCLTPQTALAANGTSGACGVAADASAPDDVEVRLAYLARVFDREIRALDTWSFIWGSVSTAAVVGQGIGFALSGDYGTRVDFGVGIGVASIGAVSLNLLPLRLTLPLRAARRTWADADRCAVLANAEDTLVRVEKEQTAASGILPHLGNLALNGGVFLVLGWGYGRWTSAAINGGIGFAVGEVTAFTQPHHLHDALEKYRSGRFDEPTPKVAWSVRPTKITADAWGAALLLEW